MSSEFFTPLAELAAGNGKTEDEFVRSLREDIARGELRPGRAGVVADRCLPIDLGGGHCWSLELVSPPELLPPDKQSMILAAAHDDKCSLGGFLKLWVSYAVADDSGEYAIRDIEWYMGIDGLDEDPDARYRLPMPEDLIGELRREMDRW